MLPPPGSGGGGGSGVDGADTGGEDTADDGSADTDCRVGWGTACGTDCSECVSEVAVCESEVWRLWVSER